MTNLQEQLKVVIPLDGSRLAERSLAFVPALARVALLDMTLLSVVDETVDVHELDREEVSQRERNLLQAYQDQVAADIRAHIGVEVNTEVLEGPPAQRILERTEAIDADLLVLSTHGRSGLSRWRMGSVADKLIRSTSVPVLVIGPAAIPDQAQWIELDVTPPFAKILVPLDGSELSERSLSVASDYASLFDSELHFVRVVNLQAYSSGLVELDYTPGVLAASTEGANSYLSAIVDRTPAPREVHEVLLGGPAEMLLSYIETRRIDLVIMTSHGRGGFLRSALGSVTERVLSGTAPVLILRADSA